MSGGLDSAVVLSICKKLGYEVYAISFNYKQRHAVELEFAVWQAKSQNTKSHKIFNIDLYGGSALTMILMYLLTKMSNLYLIKFQLLMLLEET